MVSADAKFKVTKHFLNLSGEKIRLKIERRDNFLCASITRFNFSIYVYVWFLVVITFNLTSILLNLMDIRLCGMIFFMCLCYFYKVLHRTVEESITFIHLLGYQITTGNAIGKKSLFIPYSGVAHVFINEVICKQRVLYILTVMTKGEAAGEKLIPLFTGTQPRLDCLETIYKNVMNTER